MKVNGSGDPMRPDLANTRATSRSGAAQAREAEPAAAIRLSGASTALGAGPAAEFDAARVAELKAAIRGGHFEVDSGVVADRLIASVNDLFGKPH